MKLRIAQFFAIGYRMNLRLAFAALLAGDLSGRDRYCANAETWSRWVALMGYDADASAATGIATKPRPSVH